MEEVRTRRWTRAEYDRAIEAGLFHEDEPIELIDGQLVVREPQRTPHAKAVELAIDALRAAFGSGWRIRPGLPLALDDVSEPEPATPPATLGALLSACSFRRWTQPPRSTASANEAYRPGARPAECARASRSAIPPAV